MTPNSPIMRNLLRGGDYLSGAVMVTGSVVPGPLRRKTTRSLVLCLTESVGHRLTRTRVEQVEEQIYGDQAARQLRGKSYHGDTWKLVSQEASQTKINQIHIFESVIPAKCLVHQCSTMLILVLPTTSRALFVLVICGNEHFNFDENKTLLLTGIPEVDLRGTGMGYM